MRILGVEPKTFGLKVHCSTTELYSLIKLLSKQYLFLFQPHVPVGLPCYDFILVLSYIINSIHIKFNIVNNSKTNRKITYTVFSDKTQSQHVTGGVCKV